MQPEAHTPRTHPRQLAPTHSTWTYAGQNLTDIRAMYRLLRRTQHECHCNAYGDEYACNPRVHITPLPTTYWQTPVNAENVQNWYAITGPWLGLAANFCSRTYNGQCTIAAGNYNPYTTAPTTGHILWTTPWCEGGVAGGDAVQRTESGDYWITSQYEPKWAPVVINGIMYSTWYTTTTC